ncbi:hypothetical protein FACS1894141_0900 [Spirochaetia bacterium]|nr:hypothetical protein FACS1894141_0900 [Spirochaetia bacterium]
MTLTLKDETDTYEVATIDHAIDSRCRRVFNDLISLRNELHWDPMNIENFLLNPGKLVSRRITRTLTALPEALAALIASEQFKNIEKIIVCAYTPFDMTQQNETDDFGKVMNGIRASVPSGAEMLAGWITGDRVDKDRVGVHLIAICSRTADEALFFYKYVSQYIKEDFIIEGFYAYKRIDAYRDIFLELEHNKLKVGYRGINQMEKELSALLNHNQFKGYFSEIIVDATQDKLYKYYYFNHEVTDGIKNAMEALYIREMLSILETNFTVSIDKR